MKQISYIDNIKLYNIRGFKELELNLYTNNESRKRTFILGKNGTCKTTLLRCIAIGLCDPEDGNSLIAEPIGNLIAENSNYAEIKITLRSKNCNNNPYEIFTKIIKKDSKEIVDFETSTTTTTEKFFVCGYGAGRSFESPEKFRGYRIIDSVYTLFSYEQGLTPAETILRRLKDYLGDKIYEYTLKGIKKALSLSEEDEINLPKGGGVMISGPSIGKEIPLEGWADGYKISFNWILDLYGRAMQAKRVTKKGGIKGILLVDELEQHIHPSIQAGILPRLSGILPEMQIFATTHSPSVILGASHEELVVLKRDKGNVFSIEKIPDFTLYSAEDILKDKNIFDSEVYSLETNDQLKKYYALAAKSKRTKEEQKELNLLAKDIQKKQLPLVEESPLLKEIKSFQKKYDL